jgi:parvulin-like peptidyl-prolyl isomerase
MKLKKMCKRGPFGIRPATVVLAALFLVLGACRSKSAGADPAAGAVSDPKSEAIVLRVEGTAYSAADFEAYVKLDAGIDLKSLEPGALSRIFDTYVQEKLLLARAKARNIQPTPEERAAYLAKLKGASTISGTDAPATTIDEASIADKLVIEKYLASIQSTLTVDNAAMAAYYDEHKKEFLQPERVQVSQILLESEAKATDLLNRIKNGGEEQFRTAARAESKGLEAPKGGLLGEFSAGQLPPELEKAIFVLKTGEISRVVESSYGFHIFRLDKRFETRLRTLTDAIPAIRAKLFEEKSQALVAAHIEELKSTLEWKADTDKLPFPYQRIES